MDSRTSNTIALESNIRFVNVNVGDGEIVWVGQCIWIERWKWARSARNSFSRRVNLLHSIDFQHIERGRGFCETTVRSWQLSTRKCELDCLYLDCGPCDFMPIIVPGARGKQTKNHKTTEKKKNKLPRQWNATASASASLLSSNFMWVVLWVAKHRWRCKCYMTFSELCLSIDRLCFRFKCRFSTETVPNTGHLSDLNGIL